MYSAKDVYGLLNGIRTALYESKRFQKSTLPSGFFRLVKLCTWKSITNLFSTHKSHSVQKLATFSIFRICPSGNMSFSRVKARTDYWSTRWFNYPIRKVPLNGLCFIFENKIDFVLFASPSSVQTDREHTWNWE